MRVSTFYKSSATVATSVLFAGTGMMITDHAINPYTTDGTQLEITASSTIPEAGNDAVAIDTTQPKITLSKWNGEAQMGVTYDGMDADTTGARPFLSKDVEWSDANQTMQVVPLQASSTMEDGGYEINIVLNSEPASSVFNFSIDNADQYNFFYQTPLWQEAGLKAPTKDCTDTDCTDTEGVSHRPDNVVGSYAVYFKDHANHVEGQTNYATGKAYQIFRPKVTDASGNEVWADLSYSDGILVLTVPRTFLDTASYPVTIDPTFGYTTGGGTSINSTSAQSSKYTSNSDTGTVTSMSAYCSDSVAGNHIAVAIYSDSSGAPNTNLSSVGGTAKTCGASPSFTSENISYTAAPSTTYWLATEYDGTTNFIYYDTGAANQRTTNGGVQYPNWDATWVAGTFTARMESIYATYTAGATKPTNLYIANGTLKIANGTLRIN